MTKKLVIDAAMQRALGREKYGDLNSEATLPEIADGVNFALVQRAQPVES